MRTGPPSYLFTAQIVRACIFWIWIAMEVNYRVTCLIYGIGGTRIRGQYKYLSSPRTPSLIIRPLPVSRMSSATGKQHIDHPFHDLSLIPHIDPVQEGLFYPFNYVPSFAAGITFVALFSLVTSMSYSPSLSRKQPLTFFRPSSHPSSTREDVVVAPDCGHRWCGGNHWLER
jgi:hypothetical protein